MIVSIIVAADKNWVIGIEGKMPWHLPADMKHFKEITTGHHVIMGRRTFEDIGKPLPNRTNIIISRNKDLKIEGCVVVHDIREALDFAKAAGEKECFVIGGGTIYMSSLLWADKVYLTKIEAVVAGDTYFPPLEETNWKETEHKIYKADEKNEYDFVFSVFERVSG